MDYAQQQRNPGKHAVGIGIVLVMHLLLAWAIVSGLARKVVDVIKAPIETKIIEEVAPPPPPPPENLPPPPKFAPPERLTDTDLAFAQAGSVAPAVRLGAVATLTATSVSVAAVPCADA